MASFYISEIYIGLIMYIGFLQHHEIAANGIREFDIKNDQFILNGTPFVIMGADMLYARCRPQLWEDRLSRLRSMGLNTIQTCKPVFPSFEYF